jgi:hypothetical protein
MIRQSIILIFVVLATLIFLERNYSIETINLSDDSNYKSIRIVKRNLYESIFRPQKINEFNVYVHFEYSFNYQTNALEILYYYAQYGYDDLGKELLIKAEKEAQEKEFDYISFITLRFSNNRATFKSLGYNITKYDNPIHMNNKPKIHLELIYKKIV